MPNFTPPVVFHTPPILPETRGIARRLFARANPQAYGVYVFKMSDGSYVQSEATAENSNTSLPPYPLMPDQGTSAVNLVARSEYYTQASGYVHSTTAVSPYAVVTYYGGRANPISSAEATLLTNYTAFGTGYADCIA